MSAPKIKKTISRRISELRGRGLSSFSTGREDSQGKKAAGQESGGQEKRRQQKTREKICAKTYEEKNVTLEKYF
jgi:hypothetical protein